MKASENNELLNEVADFAGVKIYTLKDITKISAARGVSAEKAKRFASLCLTSTEMGQLLDVALEAVNKRQDIAQAISIIHELKFRHEMICEENSLLELAYIYLLIDGEDIDVPSNEYNAKKAKLVNERPEIKGFFLQWGLQLVEIFSKKPGVDLLSYLEETKHLMIKLSRHLPQ
jgi:hypothetical protein